MAPQQTEWSLQKCLTNDWLAQDLVLLGGEPLFLLAWEVMTSYRINDSRRHWNEPSIDFLLLDRTGRIVVVELKREVRSPREAWSVLCQVTHRAHALAIGYEQSRLEAAYLDCRSGMDGRTALATPPHSLVVAHADAFEQCPRDRLQGTPVRRIVMAKAFGGAFPRVLASFNHDPAEQVATSLGRYQSRGEIKRYLGLGQLESMVDPSPIRAVTTDGAVWTE